MTEPTTPAPPDDMPFEETPPHWRDAEAASFPVTFTGHSEFNTLRLQGEGEITFDRGDAIVDAGQQPASGPARRIRFMFPLGEITRVGLNDGALVMAIEPKEQPGKTHVIAFYVASEEDAHRVVAILHPPKTAGMRDDHPEAAKFFQVLRRTTPLATQALLIANIAIFALMAAGGVGVLVPDDQIKLIRWGARLNPLIDGGQWWRIITPMFVHIGLLHLAMNMWALKNLGDFVERLFGTWRFLALYFAAGIIGNAASYYLKPDGVAAGASGAIFGILGALTAFIYRRHHSIPRETLSNLRANAFSFIILNLALGFSIPEIDNSAHIGGLVSGLVLGWLLARPLPDPETMARPRPFRKKVAPVMMALAFIGLMTLNYEATQPKAILSAVAGPMVTKMLREHWKPDAPACEEVILGEAIGKNHFRATARLAGGMALGIEIKSQRGGIEVTIPDDTKIEQDVPGLQNGNANPVR